jgi:stearoyl-CoA desaturase (delta-9 desaturase)
MSLLWVTVITFVILQGSVMCTTIYLHRCLTHRGLEVNPFVAFLMHLHLLLFTGIAPREWVAVHRKHHQFSDKEGDPHSPYLLGMWNVLFGNFLYYRRVAKDPVAVRKYAPDYKGTILDRMPLHGHGVLAGLGIFALMFGWGWGVSAWLFHIVAYILLNSSINSICHMVGYRNFDNLATNVRLIAWMTGGEGLHNNHHERPTSAHFAMKTGEFDPAWVIIRSLEVLGLAKARPELGAKAA